ncbi:MAG: hypothetical protein RR281_00655, partial [Pseudoflavonifractor sp.]
KPGAAGPKPQYQACDFPRKNRGTIKKAPAENTPQFRRGKAVMEYFLHPKALPSDVFLWAEAWAGRARSGLLAPAKVHFFISDGFTCISYTGRHGLGGC